MSRKETRKKSFFFLLIPSIILALFFFPSPSSDVIQILVSLSSLFSPVPTTVRAFLLYLERTAALFFPRRILIELRALNTAAWTPNNQQLTTYNNQQLTTYHRVSVRVPSRAYLPCEHLHRASEHSTWVWLKPWPLFNALAPCGQLAVFRHHGCYVLVRAGSAER